LHILLNIYRIMLSLRSLPLKKVGKRSLPEPTPMASCSHPYRTPEMGEVRKLTAKPDTIPKTKTPGPVSLQILDSESGSVPISAMFLHAFYIHHTIHSTEARSGFSQKLKSVS